MARDRLQAPLLGSTRYLVEITASEPRGHAASRRRTRPTCRSNQQGSAALRGFVRPAAGPRLVLVMKRSIFAFGLLGLIGCFLPLTLGVSLFEMRSFDPGWSVWLVIAAYAVPTLVGGSRSESERVAAIAGTVSFGYLAYKFGTGVFDLVVHGSIGGIMMGIAVVGGLASSLLALSSKKS
jgi:hypothetical protein